jgi:hypothetical protein
LCINRKIEIQRGLVILYKFRHREMADDI